MRKPLVRLGAGLVLFVLLHQLSYIDYFVVTRQVSVSTELITMCPRPDHESPGDDRAATEIPNIVHQIWKTADVRTYSAQESHSSWKAMLKPMNYTSRLWTDDDIVGLIKSEYLWLLPTYEGYSQDIQRADLARLIVVHARGGFYADLDVHPRSAEALPCLQRLKLDAIFASTSDASPGLSNHFFVAERGSAFLWALNEAKRRGASVSKRILLPYLQVFWSTGPMMLTTASREYAWSRGADGPSGLGVLSGPFVKSVVRHAPGRSWHSLDGRLLNSLEDHARLDRPCMIFSSMAAILVFVWITIRLFRRQATRSTKKISH